MTNNVKMVVEIMYDANNEKVRNEVFKLVHDFRLNISKKLNYITFTSQKEVKA